MNQARAKPGRGVPGIVKLSLAFEKGKGNTSLIPRKAFSRQPLLKLLSAVFRAGKVGHRGALSKPSARGEKQPLSDFLRRLNPRLAPGARLVMDAKLTRDTFAAIEEIETFRRTIPVPYVKKRAFRRVYFEYTDRGPFDMPYGEGISAC